MIDKKDLILAAKTTALLTGMAFAIALLISYCIL